MTSMTEVGGLVSTAPQWRLGEMGQLAQEHMNHKINSLDELNLYMQRNDADLLYGSRILAQIDAILEDVRRNGISKDLAVAVESTRPGTIPKNVQKILTSNYTGTHQRETVMALESWKEAGRMGLIILVLTAILKMVSWLVTSGKGYKGNTNGKGSADTVEEFKQKTEEKFTAAADTPPAEMKKSVDTEEWKRQYEVAAKTIKCASVKDAFMRAANDVKNTRFIAQLTLSAARIDAMLKTTDAVDYVDTVSAITNRNPIYPVLKAVAAGEKGNDGPEALIQELMRMNVTEAVFTPQAADQAYNRLPKAMRQAGVRIPNESVFRILNNRAPELNGFFNDASKTFDELSRLMSRRGKDGQWGSGELEAPGASFAHAMRHLNDYLATTIPAVSLNKMSSDAPPTMAIDESDARHLIGYDEPTEFIGRKVLVGAQYGAYLNSSFLSAFIADNNLRDDDANGVLSAMVVLAKGISSNTSVTSFDTYAKMEKSVKDLIDTMEQWDKDLRRSDTGKEGMAAVGKMLHGIMMEERSDSLNVGREISSQYDDSADGDFWAGLRRNLNYVRRICMGTVGLQNIINKSDRNPFIAGKEK